MNPWELDSNSVADNAWHYACKEEGMRFFLISLLAIAFAAPHLCLPGKRLTFPVFRNPASDEATPPMGRAERIYRDGCRLFHMGVDPQKLAEMQERDRTRVREEQEFRAQLERDGSRNSARTRIDGLKQPATRQTPVASSTNSIWRIRPGPTQGSGTGTGTFEPCNSG